MSEAYLVRIKSSAGMDRLDTLQVIAPGPAEAAEAVRGAVDPDALVEAEPEPISTEHAVDAGLLTDTVRLG